MTSADWKASSVNIVSYKQSLQQGQVAVPKHPSLPKEPEAHELHDFQIFAHSSNSRPILTLKLSQTKYSSVPYSEQSLNFLS